MDKLTRKKLLESYAGYDKKKVSGTDFFPVILISFLIFFLLAGLYLRSNGGSAELIIENTSKTTTRFMFEEKKRSRHRLPQKILLFRNLNPNLKKPKNQKT